MTTQRSRIFTFLVAAALLFPAFFQLSHGIYRDLNPIYDSGGILGSLPLPISIVACLVAILAHLRGIGRARQALVFAASLTAIMAVSCAVTGAGRSKLMYAAQTMLPVMGLVLGMLLGAGRATIARAFSWVLLVLLPLQLLAGWYQGGLMLTNYLYVFSVYQHIQFVPIVLAVAFGFVVAHEWENRKGLMCFLTAITGVYVLASGAFLAIGFYAGFVLFFFGSRVWKRPGGRIKGLACLAAGIAAAVFLAAIYYSNVKGDTDRFGNASAYLQKFHDLAEGKLPQNVARRLDDWKMYSGWIVESPGTLLFGHPAPPAREVTTSAHNWYLDFAYNFGIAGLAPLLAMIGFTVYSLWQQRKTLSTEIWWLAGFLFFLVVIDNSFKVTLRQPYPGIFIYFLWGLLLASLRNASSREAGD